MVVVSFEGVVTDLGVPPGEPSLPSVNGELTEGSSGSMQRQTFLYKGTGEPGQLLQMVLSPEMAVGKVVIFLFQENVGEPTIQSEINEEGVPISLNIGEYAAGRLLRIIVFG